jgi:cytochrome b561
VLIVAPVSGFLASYVDPGFAGVHRLARLAFIALIALHALAALFHHFFLRDSIPRRMLLPVKPTIE